MTSMVLEGQVWYLIVSIPDLCNLITLSVRSTKGPCLIYLVINVINE